MNGKIKIILIEDNEIESKEFEDYINHVNNVSLISHTKSSIEAIELVKKHSPDTIILDLELHNGLGSGFDFLSGLNNLALHYKPFVIVTTNIVSNVIYDRLHKDFVDLIGISYRLKGRDYLFEAIYYLLTNDEQNANVFQHLSKHYKLLISSISRAIQTAINHTWRTSSIEDLRANYTAPINFNTGVPTPTEFIYYIVKKLKS